MNSTQRGPAQVRRETSDQADLIVVTFQGRRVAWNAVRPLWLAALERASPFADQTEATAAMDRLIAALASATLQIVVGRNDSLLWCALEPASPGMPGLTLPTPAQLGVAGNLAIAKTATGAYDASWLLAGCFQWRQMGMQDVVQQQVMEWVDASVARFKASQAPADAIEVIENELRNFGGRLTRRLPVIDAWLVSGSQQTNGWCVTSRVWRPNQLPATPAPLRLLNHLDERTWAFVVCRPQLAEAYDLLATALRAAYTSVVKLGSNSLTFAEQQVLWKARRMIETLAESWNKTLSQQLLPSLQGCELACSASWSYATSRPLPTWPSRPEPVKMPSLSLMLVVPDMPAYASSWSHLFAPMLSCWTAMRQAFPDETPSTISIPKLSKAEAADAASPSTAYLWPFPQGWRLDERIAPHARIEGDVVVAGFYPAASAGRFSAMSSPPCADLLEDWREPLQAAWALDCVALSEELAPWLRRLSQSGSDDANSQWPLESSLAPAIRSLGRLAGTTRHRGREQVTRIVWSRN